MIQFIDEIRSVLNKSKATGWIGLRRWGNSRIVRTSFFWLLIVPILARFLQHTPEDVSITVWDQTFKFSIQLPFRWWMLFVTSVFFAIAQVIYLWGCPDMIRLHKDYDDFEKYNKGAINLGHYLCGALRGMANNSNYDDKVELLKYIVHGDSIKHATDTSDQLNQAILTLQEYRAVYVINSSSEETKSDIFDICRAYYNSQLNMLKIMCQSFFLMGGLFVLFLFVQSCWTVWSIVIRPADLPMPPLL